MLFYHSQITNYKNNKLAICVTHRMDFFIVPPRIVGRREEDMSVVEGHMISLLCDVQSYPPADIIWTKDGQVLEFSTGIHILPGDLPSKCNSLCVSAMFCVACMHVCNVPSSCSKVVRCCSFPGLDSKMPASMSVQPQTQPDKTKRAFSLLSTVRSLWVFLLINCFI